MSAVSAFAFDLGDRGSNRRWSGSLAAVVGVHALAGVLLLGWANRLVPVEPVPPAIMIDMAPVPAAAPPAPPPPVPKIKARPPEPKQPKIELKEDLPIMPSEAELPAVRPAPVAEAAPSPAPAPSASPAAKAAFESMLLAHLERFKRYPPEARLRRQQGVAVLRFSMDRQGHVLAHKLHRTSGYTALDDEVMALILRAQPLPPIPPERSEDQLDLVVPVQFFIK